jgi:hypothetical protein
MNSQLEKLDSLNPKQLRTLRNSLNNRLQAFKEKGEEGAKTLSASHRLYGLKDFECKLLLDAVQKKLKAL